MSMLKHNFRKIATDADAVRGLIRTDPSCLFVIVGPRTYCTCGGWFGRCNCEGEYFVHLLIRNKTLHADMLHDVPRDGTDWFRLSTLLRLDTCTLEKHACDIDWRGVSGSPLYTIDLFSIERFQEYISWPIFARSYRFRLDAGSKLAEDVVFKKRLVPLN